MFNYYKVSPDTLKLEEPTEKQVQYAKEIASFLNVDLPEEYTKVAYKRFIERYQEEYVMEIKFLSDMIQWDIYMS